MYTPVKMPLWGPYSKKYMGLSHIPAQLGDIGARFDFTVHPTVWNANVPVPNVTVPSNYHLMACAPDFSYYAYRLRGCVPRDSPKNSNFCPKI